MQAREVRGGAREIWAHLEMSSPTFVDDPSETNLESELPESKPPSPLSIPLAMDHEKLRKTPKNKIFVEMSRIHV